MGITHRTRYSSFLLHHTTTSKLEMEDLRERFYGGNDQSKEAFEELFAMGSALEAEREESRENARIKVEALYDKCHALRVKNQNLKAKYLALLDLYNQLAEEVKDRSDSSSGSSSDEEDKNCSLM